MAPRTSDQQELLEKLNSTVPTFAIRNENKSSRFEKENSRFAALTKRNRSSSAPPTTRRKRLIEEHFRVDPLDKKLVLPGVPKHEDDWPRDLHDFFNLVALVPVVVLNVMNWNWDMLLHGFPKNKSIPDAWTGEWFEVFFAVTVTYFLVDLCWVILIPKCVKSPLTIIQHHIATLLYIVVPFVWQDCRWVMGACMSVEINTWFLISRRVFNKQGFPPWTLDIPYLISIRIKLISVCFYLSWISIRCIIYPYLLWDVIMLWVGQREKTGRIINIALLAVPLHMCFCILNLKWSYDLLMSKVRYWKRLKAGKVIPGERTVDKGL
eukprot:CAMPEP_0194031656 /NCGR_PEP_ID=MMETSP0009_2-20130614/4775_1 /TAXON_ID=210454 /ORGANISM="Grammatophora oceanica, Strain CCMP 410" /LENGTH=321 /DNA_ID=CAMNT_0038671869 /DNA_START=42 /DNA_END=1007 /DNA_ORIENTATION=-